MHDRSEQPELFQAGVDDALQLRYRRQMQFAMLGKEGQRKLSESSVAICGCGALGTVLAERMVRAGVGRVRIIDRDWVEWDNLPRQSLFTEADAKERLPKAIAAVIHLKLINSQTAIEPIVSDLTFRNAGELLSGSDLLLDGTDNFETRLLINDYSISTGVPWVHGGCIGANGQVMVILPGETACFRCLVSELPPADAVGTCDTVGVLGPAVSLVASWQAMEAIKILSGHRESAVRNLIVIDMWEGTARQVSLERLRRSGRCVTCGQNQFEFLSGSRASSSTVLCGKNAVQIQPGQLGPLDLQQIANRLQSLGTVEVNPFLIRLSTEQHQVTIFRDGRAIVGGTEDTSEARTIYARLLGG